MLIAKHIKSQAGVQLRVVQPPALELAILIVLYQVVIGVARKGQRIEPQGIHHGQPEQAQIRLGRSQMRCVERHQVMAEQKGGALGEGIQLSSAVLRSPLL